MILSYIVGARNTTPEALTAALAPSLLVEIEAANGWCWARVPMLFPDTPSPLRSLDVLDGPCLLVTEESPRRWRLHLRKRGEQPFDTMHVYHWIEREPGTMDAEDDDEDPFRIVKRPALMGCIDFYLIPPSSLTPVEFDPDGFDPYRDDHDERPIRSVAAYIAETYESSGLSLPRSIKSMLGAVSNEEAYQSFLALHAAHIGDALARFEIPHDRNELLGILTGESLLFGELNQSSGNLLRFLRHLGLGPTIAQKLVDRKTLPGDEIRGNPSTKVVEVAGALPLNQIESGPYFVSLEEVFLLFRCAQYQDNHVECVALIQAGAPLERPKAWIPPYAQYASTPDGACLFVGSGLHYGAKRERQRLGAMLQHIPEGARLDLLFSGEHASMRLSGAVEGDRWRMEATSVPLACGDIEHLLDLFRTVEARSPQILRNDEEMEAVLTAAAGHPTFYASPPRRDGLALAPSEAADSEGIGQLLFRHRFAHVWDFSEFDRRQADFLKRLKQYDADTAREFAPTATKQVLVEGAASRFFEADYNGGKMDRDMRKAVRNFKPEDTAMAALGFVCVGAIVCERAEPGIHRCYANATERSFGFYHVQSWGTTWHDFYTLFDDETILITTTGESEGSFRSLRILSQSRPGLALDKLHEEHVNGIARFKDRGLNPASINANLQGACGLIDQFLMRRLGSR